MYYRCKIRTFPFIFTLYYKCVEKFQSWTKNENTWIEKFHTIKSPPNGKRCVDKNRGPNVLGYFQRLIGIITLIIYSININNNNHIRVSSLNSIFSTFNAINWYGVAQLRFLFIPSTTKYKLFVSLFRTSRYGNKVLVLPLTW